MKIGYIRRKRLLDGTEKFEYIEGNGIRRIGTRADTVKVKLLYGTIPYDEIKSNTEDMNDRRFMFASVPFITNDELAERCKKWCDWANSCKHREYSFFGDTERGERMNELNDALSALVDMVNQFAYRTTYYGKEALQDGGLSALENAFCVLENAGCKINNNGTIQRKNLWAFMEGLDNEKKL